MITTRVPILLLTQLPGYDGKGTIRFVGKHFESGSARVGVEMDTMVGKNNGTVKGHEYFKVPRPAADHPTPCVPRTRIPPGSFIIDTFVQIGWCGRCGALLGVR